ncbi:MAG: lysylphosphatidylglycerol synthase domain-containing protein [Pirellulaceae bacterium]
MADRVRWIKLLFHAVALVLVIWGIWQTVRKSARQLALQRAELSSRAADLEQRSEATDGEQAVAMREEAERLRQQVRDFWKADAGGLWLAGCCYALGMLPAALYWRRCLIALDQHAPWLAILWAYFYGNLGKYFPGKAMVIVLRLGALEKFGIKRIATSITIFMETLTMMAVGGAVAAGCLLLLNLDWKLSVLALALLVMTFVPIAPPLLKRLIPRLQKGVDTATLAQWSDRINWPLISRGWLTLGLTWIGFGLSLLLVLRSLPSADFGDASSTTIALSVFGASALAVVLGFVSLIPGGAGVREVVLSTVLTPVVGPTAALCSALWVRIVWLATELALVALLGILNMAMRRLSQSAREPAFHETVG